MDLFDQDELFEIDLIYANVRETARVEAEVKRVLTLRHGDEDFTVTSQVAMLDVFGKVMDVVTMAVGAIVTAVVQSSSAVTSSRDGSSRRKSTIRPASIHAT